MRTWLIRKIRVSCHVLGLAHI